MQRRRTIPVCLAAVALAGCAVTAPSPSRDALVQQVTAAEVAFAKTIVDRDIAAFAGFVSEEAVFLNGGKPLRGRAAIVAHWNQFYASGPAPFTWKPDLVEVLPSGLLAQSIGPVSGPDGKVFARFYSTWRLEPDGRWRVVFDDGYPVRENPPR